MTNNERFSQLEMMMSDVLKRLDQVTQELRVTNETLRQQGERQDGMLQRQDGMLQQQNVMLQRQQVILDVLVRQTDTNTAIMQRLENHEGRLRNLEGQDPRNAA